MSQTDCPICRKHQNENRVPGGPLYMDELVYAGHSFLSDEDATAYLGYLIVEPRRHVPGLAELTEQEAAGLGQVITRLSHALKESEKAEHIYLFVLGHHVDHLHYHLIPRYPGTPREYWGVRVDEWPDAPRGDETAVTTLCNRIRHYLEASL
jgi:histidine triad (HIT) family protein